MASQERVNKNKSQAKQEEVLEETAKTEEATKSDQELKDELDAMLDEIDSVLEVNAEEFVKGFVQKGGELCRTTWDSVKSGFLLPIRGMFPLGLQ